MLAIAEKRLILEKVAMPNLKDAADFLGDLCDELLGTMQDIEDIVSELEQPDQVRIDNVEDVSIFFSSLKRWTLIRSRISF